MEKVTLGIDKGAFLAEPLDTWLTAGAHDYAVPEASGSSARVFKYKDQKLDKKLGKDTAIKIMRPDKISYATPLFLEELRILRILDGKQGVTKLIKAGYLEVCPETNWPYETAPLTKQLELQAGGSRITGELFLFDIDDLEAMLTEYQQRIEEGFLPVILLERRWEDSLYLLCDAGYTRGEFLKNFSMSQILEIASQISGYLAVAHQNEIVYMDHKLLHYYWNDIRQQVLMLDWNIGRYLPGSLSEESIQFDLLQFSSRALHHLFTGRQAPGAVAVGQNRPEDIANSPKHFKASYPYDVEKRLNSAEIAFLERSLDGEFSSASEMKEAIEKLQENR